MDADLIEVGRQRPVVALPGAVRVSPDLVRQRLHGEHPPTVPQRLTLRDTTKLRMTSGGWVLLGERPPEEIALGRGVGITVTVDHDEPEAMREVRRCARQRVASAHGR
jgi:predicted kinase